MKAQDIHRGIAYVYRASAWDATARCVPLSEPSKGYVTVELFERDAVGSKSKTVPTRRLRQPWSEFDPELVKKYNEFRVKAKAKQEEKEREIKLKVKRIDHIDSITEGKIGEWMDDLRNSVKRGGAGSSIMHLKTLETLIETLTGQAPIPADGPKCNKCEERPAMLDHYLCRECLYGH
jgi:hypothetical protein